MEIKDLTEDEWGEIANLVDNEGFWYSLSGGGWLRPEEILSDEKDIQKVKEAIAIVEEFEKLVPVL